MSENGNALSLENLSSFVVKRILSDNPDRKIVFVEGSFTDRDGSAVLILEKTAFAEKGVKALCSPDSTLSNTFANDVYTKYDCFVNSKLNGKIFS